MTKLFSQNVLYTILSFIPGLIIFSFYFDFSIVIPSNTFWIYQNGGDLMQHYLGSVAYRFDEWYFPITKTTSICFPEGVSIVYTDSNSLLSILSKLFRSVFLPEYQFIGLWYLLCFSLQSFMAYLVLNRFTGDKLYSIIGSVLFCLLPTLIFRTGHENLMAFWLILLAIFVLSSPSVSLKRKFVQSFLVLMLSLFIHAYISIMIIILIFFCMGYEIYILHKRNQKWVKDASIGILSVIVITSVVMWLLGYFYNKPIDRDLSGFGYFSMNILAVFNPLDSIYSNFLPTISIKDGQYEGFQYVGLGVLLLWSIIVVLFFANSKHILKEFKFILFGILLFIFGIILLFLKVPISHIGLIFFFFLVLYVSVSRTVPINQYFKPLFWASAVCFLIALSNKIYIGEQHILKIHIGDETIISKLFAAIRSSGRFFWVTMHVLLLAGIVLLYKIVKKQIIAYFLLCLCIVFQLFDLSQLADRINSSDITKVELTALSENNKEVILASSSVNFIYGFDMDIAWYSILNRIPINTFYMAHGEGPLTLSKLSSQRETIFAREIDLGALYLFSVNDTTLFDAAKIKWEFNQKFFTIPPYEE